MNPQFRGEIGVSLHASETLHERLRSGYWNCRLTSPGNDAPRFEEAARGSLVGSMRVAERHRGVFFEQLGAAVAVQIGRGGMNP